MKYAWIAGNAKRIRCRRCARRWSEQQRLSGVAARGQANGKRLSDAQLLALIRAIHAELKGAYGSPRMVREMRARGFPAGKTRVERLMRENGIRARHKRR